MNNLKVKLSDVIAYEKWDVNATMTQIAKFYCDGEGIDDKVFEMALSCLLRDVHKEFNSIVARMATGDPFFEKTLPWFYTFDVDNDFMSALGEKITYKEFRDKVFDILNDGESYA